jgi:hypothetical protein
VKVHGDRSVLRPLSQGVVTPQGTQALESGTKEPGQAREAMARDPEICVDGDLAQLVGGTGPRNQTV